MGVGEYKVNDNKNGLTVRASWTVLWSCGEYSPEAGWSGSAYPAFVRWKDWEFEYPGLKELTLPQHTVHKHVFQSSGMKGRLFCTLQCMWREVREYCARNLFLTTGVPSIDSDHET